MNCCRPIDVFVRTAGHAYRVPCGKCEECLQRKKMTFVHRCEQEKLHGQYKHCYFVTLTYATEFLPYEYYTEKRFGKPVRPDSTGEPVLCPYDLSMFFHRFRNFAGDSIRYFACGEYGSEVNTHRPHYHIILFTNLPWRECVDTANLAWSNLRPESKDERNRRYKLQRKLHKPVKRDGRNMVNRVSFGRVQVTSVTYKRICYVGKYVNKIMYSREPIPPFYRMSNGLGDGFLKSDTARLCALQNRHFTFFENGLPVALSRYYSQRMFTAEQMEQFQMEIFELEYPDSVYSVHERVLAWVAYQERLKKQRYRRYRLYASGLSKYY